MAIGILTLLFIVVSLISLFGILLLFLWKDGSGREALFYLLAAWGLLIAACSILSLPSSFMLSRTVSFSFGLLSAAGLFWHRNMEKEDDGGEIGNGRFTHLVSFLLVTASILLGILKLYGLV